MLCIRELPRVIIILEANADSSIFCSLRHSQSRDCAFIFPYLDENVSKHPLRHVDPEGGDTTLFQNVDNYLPGDTE
jgi:hypothetical protein